MNKYKNILSAHWLKYFLILVLVYLSQVNPFLRLPHYHENALSKHEVISQPIDADVEHSPGHHHHDGNRSHTNDHQHTYDRHIDWHIIRIQNPRRLAFYGHYTIYATSFILTTDNNISSFVRKKLPFIDEEYVSSHAIRGPPLQG